MSAQIIKLSEAAALRKKIVTKSQATLIEIYLSEIRKEHHPPVEVLDDMTIHAAIDIHGFVDWYKKRFGCVPPVGRFLRKKP